MSNTRDTGFLRNAIQVTDQGVTFVSGSTTLMSISSSGAVTTTGVISGSNALSASFSLNSALLNGIGSVGFATTGALLEVSSSQQQISSSLLQVSASYISLSGSYNTFSGSASTRITANSSSIQQVSSSQQQISASLLNVVANYATTGSNSFRANQSITGSLVVSSTITAQTLVVQTVTSSIVYSSGSNIFGNQLANTQTFTGSVNITGSLVLIGNITGNAVTLTGTLGGTSAVFSSTVQATQYTATSTGGSGLRIYGAAGTHQWDMYLNGGNLRFSDNTSGGSFVVDTAATFSSTIGTAGDITITKTSAASFIANNTSASGKSYRLVSTDAGTFVIQNTGILDLVTIASTGAATFISSATATQFNVSASGGTTQIYNTGGGHTVITNATANKDMNYQTSGTGGHYFNTAGVDRLIINASGNVGIGITSIVNASAKLEVKGDLFVTPSGSAASKLHLYNADSSNESYIYDAGATTSSVITLAPAGSTSLSVAATTVKIASGRRLVINTDGNYQLLAQDLSFGSGIREIFRVPHNSLCTGGKFSIVGTGNSFVHSSQWAWNSTHNGGYGRCYIIQLTSGDYSNITMYADTTTTGDVIICTNLTGAFTMNVVIEKTGGGAIDLTYQNADRTSAASGYTRVQTTTSISYGSQFYSVVAATLGGAGNRAVYSDSVGLLTNSSSDVTLKKNVENIAYGLNSIMALRPIAFNWIPENLGPQKEIGFIAQEVQQSIPELIGTNKDETLSLDYPKLTAVLTKAIQEQNVLIQELQAKLQRNNIN